MPDAATIGVLRDVTILALMALALGMYAYRAIRRAYPLTNWNEDGNVVARLYGVPDAVLALLLLSPYLLGLLLADTSAAATAAAGKHESLQVGSIISQIVLVLGEAVVLVLFLRRVRGFDPAELFGVRTLPLSKVVAYAFGAIAPTFLVVVMVNMGASEFLKGVWARCFTAGDCESL